MDFAYSAGSGSGGPATVWLDESFEFLPPIYLAFFSIWFVCSCCWTLQIFKNRRFRTNSLLLTLATLPMIKSLQLALCFLFWYSCFYYQTCSLWISFGAYVVGIIFKAASFVCFSLISHGYSIMFEHLSVAECRKIAILGCVFYLILVGDRASIPYFSVLLLLTYIVLFYMIFHHTSKKLSALREQLTFIEAENVQATQNAAYTKYILFKKFQGAMQIVAVAETMMYVNIHGSSEKYWLRLLIQEWAQFCIFLYISWTFRCQDLVSHISIMSNVKSKPETNLVPPIYSIEMDAETFKSFSSQGWHIGVQTSGLNNRSCTDSVLVMIQHPHSHQLRLDTASFSSPLQV